MKTVELKVYNVNELGDDARENAWRKYPLDEYFWLDEGLDSAKAFAALFGASIVRWELGAWRHSFIDSDINQDMVRGIKPASIPKPDDCPLTGYCMDYTALKAFHDHVAKSGDVLGAVVAGLDALASAIQADCEYRDSLEYWTELAEANGWQFFEDGTMF